MSLKSHIFAGRTSAGGVQHLFIQPCSGPREADVFVPVVYFEAKIDFSDVRSGFRETHNLYCAVDIHPFEGDAVWTTDMVRTIDPSHVVSGMPTEGRLQELQPFVDADYLDRMNGLFFSYLMQYFKVKVFRNFALNVYSNAGESVADFRSRCAELLDTPFRRDLNALHETFVRKVEQARERYPKGVDLSDDFESEKIQSLLKSRIHEVSSRITDLFLHAEIGREMAYGEGVFPVREPLGMYEDEKLELLVPEARGAISQLLAQYNEKIENIDEYTIHPSFKDIHLIRSYVLWLPEKAEV